MPEMIANTSVTPVHVGPSLAAAVIEELTLFEPVVPVSRTRNWSEVRLNSGVTGWVLTMHLSDDNPEQTGAPSMVSVRQASITKGAAVTSIVHALATLGTRLNVLPFAGDYCAVDVPLRNKTKGKFGTRFILKSHVVPWPPSSQGLDLVATRGALPANSLAQEAADLAHQLFGIPFKEGGSTTFGLSDLGLVRLAYRAATGIEIQRSQNGHLEDRRLTKIADVTTLDSPALEPGDILTFEQTSHSSVLGLMLDDERFVVASPWARTVSSRSVTNKFFGRRFRGAVRLSTFGEVEAS